MSLKTDSSEQFPSPANTLLPGFFRGRAFDHFIERFELPSLDAASTV